MTAHALAALAAELGRDLASVVGFLWQLTRSEYCGVVVLKFERGRVTLRRTHQRRRASGQE